MAFIIMIEGQAIGPFTKERDADKRAEAELRARPPDPKRVATVAFLVPPDMVKPGEVFEVPLELARLDRKGGVEIIRPYGDDPFNGRPPNLDDLLGTDHPGLLDWGVTDTRTGKRNGRVTTMVSSGVTIDWGEETAAEFLTWAELDGYDFVVPDQQRGSDDLSGAGKA